MAVKKVPDGYHTVTPMLIVENATGLIDFLKSAFDAVERMRMPMPDGGVAHAELTIDGSVVMVSDATTAFPSISTGIHLYVPDVDAVYRKAIDAGATSVRAPEDQFYGDRNAVVRDAFGNLWSIASHIEDVPDEEVERRMAAMRPIGVDAGVPSESEAASPPPRPATVGL